MKINTKKGFSLLEVILALILFSLLMTVIISLYNNIMKSKYNLSARQDLLQDTYLGFEKINSMLKDFDIDYEEYFNRQNVGCNSELNIGNNFKRDIGSGGYCNLFTQYGNGNNISSSNTGEFKRYFCSSISNNNDNPKVIKTLFSINRTGCIKNGFQSFGEYRLQSFDFTGDLNAITSTTNYDNYFLGLGPNALISSTGVQELYLISQDDTQRIFLRKKLINSGDRNGDGIISGDNEKQYNIQILKLKGFDAGSKHIFNINISSGVYDGIIDTRACDYSQGFICTGSSINGGYTGFNLPKDQEDGWINLFPDNITISNRNITISPIKNPDYSFSGSDEFKINPYIIISLTSKLYGKIRQKKLNQNLNDFQLTLQTTINTINNQDDRTIER